MFNRSGAALGAVALALALSAPASAATSIAGHHRVAIDRAAGTANFSDASRDRFVILQGYQTSTAAAIKAASPATKVLLYKNLSSMTAREYGLSSTGVATQDADTHPEWYLKNTSGSRFTFNGYSWLWAADIGDAGFQQKWADNVLAEIQKGPWDGVFMDDVNPSIANHYAVSAVAKYPSDAAYGAATRSALAAIGGRMRSASRLLIANFGQWESYVPLISDWLQFVDGGMDEHFTKWSGGSGVNYQTGSGWAVRLAEIRSAEAQGKAFLGISQSANGDADAARYGWATTLLVAAGHASFAMHGDYSSENWFPEYDADLGAPSAPESVLSSGVHQRVFATGLVLVNPTTSSVSVSFEGSYSGSGLTRAKDATLAPHTGLILTRDVAPGPTPAPGAPAPAQSDPAPVEPTAGQSPAAPGVEPAPAPVQLPAPAPPAADPPAAATTSRPVKVTCHSRTRCSVRVSLRSGKRAVAARTVSLRGRSARVVSLRLTPSARRALAHGGRLRVRVTAAGSGRTTVAPQVLRA